MEPSSDFSNVIFFKTDKAMEELSSRRHGLRPRARQMLLLLDGHRATRALGDMLPGAEIGELVKSLEADGFISRAHPQCAPIPRVAIPRVDIPVSTDARAEREPLDPVKLARAKAYLIEVSEHHLGVLAAKLQNEIAVVGNEPELRSAIAHWNMALRESRSGTAVADLCLQTAWNILGWEQ